MKVSFTKISCFTFKTLLHLFTWIFYHEKQLIFNNVSFYENPLVLTVLYSNENKLIVYFLIANTRKKEDYENLKNISFFFYSVNYFLSNKMIINSCQINREQIILITKNMKRYYTSSTFKHLIFYSNIFETTRSLQLLKLTR